MEECPTEQQEHFVAAAWLREMNIPHHHSPNGGYRDIREAAKFRRLGTSAGFPDLWIPLARKGYHGLYIELKRVKGGVLSDQQKYWRDLSIKEGYAWFEARGAQQMMDIVLNYLEAQG
jgi:VRR-NUC domain